LITNDLDGARDPQTLTDVTEELIRNGMWHPAEHGCPHCPTSKDGWIIHDYLDMNPSADQVRHQREQAAERQRRARQRGTAATRVGDNPSPSDRRESRRDNQVTHANVTRQSRLPTPTPTPTPKEEKKKVAALPAPDQTDDRFVDFWTIYPRKEAKAAARKAWTSAIKKTTVEVLVTAAERYRDQPDREPKFTAHASTWLNQERWTDQPSPPPVNGTRASPNGHQPYRDSDDPKRYEGDLW
jgi:hypothetical protein